MKTLLKFDFRIQTSSVFLLTIILVLEVFLQNELFMGIFIGLFFWIAITQYSLNLIKFFMVDYERTNFRRIYVATSSFTLFFFVTGNLGLTDVFGSSVFLSPLLIILSLYISYKDFKNNTPESIWK